MVVVCQDGTLFETVKPVPWNVNDHLLSNQQPASTTSYKEMSQGVWHDVTDQRIDSLACLTVAAVVVWIITFTVYIFYTYGIIRDKSKEDDWVCPSLVILLNSLVQIDETWWNQGSFCCTASLRAEMLNDF